MPASFTHFSVACEVLKRLPAETVSSLPLYFFGAQGADFCFFYRALNTTEHNFGRWLHKKTGAYAFFNVLKTCALGGKNGNVLSYALGYLTHYAADVTFHPFVYSFSGKSPAKHTRVEGALDAYFRERFSKDDLPDCGQTGTVLSHIPLKYANPKPKEEEAGELFTLYALAASYADREPLEKTNFLRAITAFRSYTFLFGKALARPDSAYLNAEGKVWKHPETGEGSTDGADALFIRSVRAAIGLAEVFLDCVKNAKPLPTAEFGKNFLSGL